MPNWNEVLKDLQGPQDQYRAKSLKKIHEHTGRNVISYYSGWLQKPALRRTPGVEFEIIDADKTGFMTCCHGVDRTKGVDLILHTPGGDVAATESLIDYLHSQYAGNIRAIIPQMAMSGGTLIALSCKEIIMGQHSSIGPVDPQVGGMPGQGLIEEFQKAADDITRDPKLVGLWQPILSKYWPTLITSTLHAIDWSDQLLKKSLERCMFATDTAAVRSRKIKKVRDLLGKQATSKSHNRHITPQAALDVGLKVTALEADNILQDLVLTLHHALTITCTQTNAIKIIENHLGVMYVIQVQQIPVVQAQAQK